MCGVGGDGAVLELVFTSTRSGKPQWDDAWAKAGKGPRRGQRLWRKDAGQRE